MIGRSPLAAACVCVIALAAVRATPQTVFRGAVDMVALDVLVTQGNRPIANLIAADFEVTDNGVRQTILDVSRETQALDVTMVIDISGSISSPLLDSLLHAVTKIRSQLKRGDRVSLVTFNQRVREVIGLSPAELRDPIKVGPTSGSTSLNDAIAIALATPPPVDRRQMAIVFTDGYDTMSFLTEAAVIDVARRARTAVFVVATESSGGTLPLLFFEKITGATGGMVQIVPPMMVNRDNVSSRITFGGKDDLLNASFLRALTDFRTSYVLRYALQGVPRPGWHELAVRVPKGGGRYQIRARNGYLNSER